MPIIKPGPESGYQPITDQPNNLNICIVSECSPSITSGVSGTLRQIVPHILEAGHQVTVVAPGPGDESIDGISMIPTKYVSAPNANFNVGVGQSAKRFGKLFASHGFDVVHVGSPMRTPKQMKVFIGGYAIDAAYDHGVPTTVIAQSNNKQFAVDMKMGFLTGMIDKQERRMHGRADINLSPSAVTDQYLFDLDIPTDRVMRWTRGVSDIFNPERRHTQEVRQLRESWGVSDDDLVVLTVGRLAPEKSFEKLAILKGLPGVKLVLVGDGAQRQELASQLGEDTIFTGELGGENLANAYAAGDIFAYPSQSDTYAQVVPEAQASGLALVVADVGGPSELVQQGVTGFKYQPAPKGGEDVELLARVKELQANPELRITLAENARAAVQGRTWKGKSLELVDYYRQAIDLRRLKSGAALGAGNLALR